MHVFRWASWPFGEHARSRWSKAKLGIPHVSFAEGQSNTWALAHESGAFTRATVSTFFGYLEELNKSIPGSHGHSDLHFDQC